jgi:hypothetical protein
VPPRGVAFIGTLPDRFTHIRKTNGSASMPRARWIPRRNAGTTSEEAGIAGGGSGIEVATAAARPKASKGRARPIGGRAAMNAPGSCPA